MTLHRGATRRRTLMSLAAMASLPAAAEAQTAPPDLPFALQTPMRCGAVSLRVRDLDRVADYYRALLGFDVLDRTRETITLGAGGVALLHLTARPGAPFEPPNQAGLFHTAFLMPTRVDLARWVMHVAAARIPVTGASDHSVSEAIYLDDPEGNGIEVYSDRPHDQWQWTNGVVTMGTYRLDVDSLVSLARGDGGRYQGAPAGLRVGHVHLRVGDIPRGRAFYRDTVGLDPTRERGGASFLSSGGYHHHVAINTWQSAGARARDPRQTGLDWFSLNVAEPGAIDAQAARLEAAGASVRPLDGGGVEAADPWGTRLRLVPVRA